MRDRCMGGGVVITGLGLVSALGTGVDAHHKALWSGRERHKADSTLRDRRARDASRRDVARVGGSSATRIGRSARSQTAEGFALHELALIAAREAWSSSGVHADPRRVALVFGSCFGQGFREFDAVTRRIGNGLDVAGPMLTVSTACASSTTAIGIARDLLVRGHADVVIAGGADSLLREAQAGFSGRRSPSAVSVPQEPE